jgi:hypothetical protein
MQLMKILIDWLENNANNQHYLFTTQDLKALFANTPEKTFRTFLSRAVRAERLDRVCRGLYIFKKAYKPDGLLLFHIAAQLRANELNYISLETALSDAGLISQIPINYISIMSSGRSSILSCGQFGTIGFVHTNQKAKTIMDQLSYDENAKLWRASVPLALSDMKATRRNCDLIDWDLANEFI